MNNLLKLAAAAVLIVGAGVAALVMTGIWPGPSAADRQRSRLMTVQAETQLRNHDQDAALRTLTEAIRLAPEDSALRTRASIYVSRNNFDGALQDVDKLIGHGVAAPGDYALRCWLRARGTALSDARGDCDRAIQLNPGLASAYGNRGLVGLKQMRYRDAWEDFNAAMRIGGSDGWLAWRLFGRGVAAWGRGRAVEGRQDVEMALHSNPAIAAQFAQFGVGGEIMRELDESTYTAAIGDPSLLGLRAYLIIYPNGAHAADARARVNQIVAGIVQAETAGQAALPGFSLAHARGSSGPDDDSFGAIALSRSTRRLAFATDYPSPEEAERAGASACNGGGVHDCEAFSFRNVCAALALSPPGRTRGMAWAHAQDDAVEGAVRVCRAQGGRNCVSVYSQCTPTPADVNASGAIAR